MFKGFVLSLLLAALPQMVQQRIQQGVVINGQEVQGVTVVQNGAVQSYTFSNPQQYVAVDQSSSGWACFDQATGSWLLHALPQQASTVYEQPPAYYPDTGAAYGYYGYPYGYSYPYPYYGYYPYFWGPGIGFGYGFGHRHFDGHGREFHSRGPVGSFGHAPIGHGSFGHGAFAPGFGHAGGGMHMGSGMHMGGGGMHMGGGGGHMGGGGRR